MTQVSASTRDPDVAGPLASSPTASGDHAPAGARAAPPGAGRTDAGKRRSALSIAWLMLDLALLSAVAVVMLAPGLDAPVIAGTGEARILEQTARMLEGRDWIGVTAGADAGAPILLHWLQMLVALASGQGAGADAWVLRLPSLAGGLATILLSYAVGRTLGSRRAALVSGLLVACTVGLGLSARAATGDAILAALVAAAMWSLASLWSDEEPRRRLTRNAVFWISVGLGVLLRAPIMILIAASALSVLVGVDIVNGRRAPGGARLGWARLAALDPLKGLVLLLIAIGPVAALAIILRDGSPAALLASHVVTAPARALPPGSHAIMSIGTFWPLFAFLPLALARSIGRDADPAIRRASTVLVAWGVPAWLVLEALPQKSAMDVLALLPAAAVLAGLAVAAGPLPVARWTVRSGFLLIAAGSVVLSFGLNAAHVLANERADAVGLLVGLAAIIAGLAATRLLRRGQSFFGIAATVVTAMLLSLLAFGVLPEARRIVTLDAGGLPEAGRTAVEPAPTPVAPAPDGLIPGRPAEPAPGPSGDPEPLPPARTDGSF